MSKKIIKAVAGGALLTALLAAPLFAQPADYAKMRSGVMKEMGGALKGLGDQAKADAPDMAVVKASAATLNADAAKLYTLFPAGSGAAAGMPGAKPEIWSMPTEFKAAQDNFANATKALAAAGDAAAFKAALGGVQQGCGGCHKTFRMQAPRPAAPPAAPTAG